MISIKKAKGNFEREPLSAPFGFKGKYVKDTWQVAALLEDESGRQGLGLGLQSPLWSDSKVFSDYGEIASNNIMYLMTEYALREAEKTEFGNPFELFEKLFTCTFNYGKRITQNPMLRKTFALNALVAVDNAAWLLYCRNRGIASFDGMLPRKVRPALSFRHDSLASVPLITYDMSIDEVMKIVNGGHFLIKIKIGSDPYRDGDPAKMLKWDMQRLSDIHACVKDYGTEYTESGRIPYYLDANGRYDSKDRLMRLLDHADKIGALERIVLLEEPFPEDYKIDVHDIPARLAADESAHSDLEAMERISMGYGAIALKPIAKTMSMSLKIARIAWQKGIPCFCADLTVNPVMVDWNKNVAARLAPLPGMKVGMLEANGHQNYLNWHQMKSYHPYYGASWIDTHDGLFKLDEGFYTESGGIFKSSPHYDSLVGI